MNHKYNWQRRWYPRSIDTSLDLSSTTQASSFKALWELQPSNQGFLFEEIKFIPCLILLGEPGIGKSFFIENEFQILKTALTDSKNETILLNLQGSNSPQYVRELLFTENNDYLSWKNGTHKLTIFLDSVDRAQIAVDDVIAVISNELRTVDVSRLELRIVCRDYDWSFTLADTLSYIWEVKYSDIDSKPEVTDIDEDPDSTNNLNRVDEGNKVDYPNVQIFQLSPLGYLEIAHAAEQNGISSQEFLDSIRKLDIMPLASSPITLQILLESYPSITSNRVNLYKNGIKKLCTVENNKNSKKLNARFDTASRIATVMILSNKYSVDVSGNNNKSLPASLSISELLVGEYLSDEELLIRETLNTSLFRGTQNRQWIHQSFAEFLTAHYLTSINMPLENILDIITTPDKKFAPQLHETIRWLSTMREDVFDVVVKQQPSLLLSMDLSHKTEKEAEDLLTKLLTLDDEFVYAHLMDDLRQLRINHPISDSILAPYLLDKSQSVYLRRFVIGIIDQIELTSFDDDLLTIIFDISEELVLRRLAADALWNVGSIEAKKKLKPFIYGRNDDPDDELKGYALLSLWSDNLTTQELFDALSPPKKQSFYGSYSMFINRLEITSDIPPEDLPVALDWIVKQPRQHEQSISLRTLTTNILCQSWNFIHLPQVLNTFASTAFSLMSRYDDIFNQHHRGWQNEELLENTVADFLQNETARRQLILATIPLILQNDAKPEILTWCKPPYILSSDLGWLIQQLNNNLHPEYTIIWVRIITRLLQWLTNFHAFIPDNLKDIDKIYYATEQNTELAKATSSYFLSDLSDPYIIGTRERYYENKETENKYKTEPPEPSPLERIQEALDKFEEGELFQWLNIITGLLLTPTGGRYSTMFEPDIQEFPSWEICSKETKERIVVAAKAYITKQPELSDNSEKDNWYISGKVPYAELFGYLAIFLILQVDAKFLNTLSKIRWQRWSKIIVRYPFKSSFRMDQEARDRHILKLQRDLMHYVYEQIPNQIINDLIHHIDAENQRDGNIYSALWKFDDCWNSHLESVLLPKIKDKNLSVISQNNLLVFLLKHDSVEAAKYAEEVIISGFEGEDKKNRLVSFCASLMNYPNHMDWSIVWDVIENDTELGKIIIEKVADADHRQGHLANKLNASQLADLFIWVEEQYPSRNDPDVDGFHAVSRREQVGHWRNNLISTLRAKNDSEVLNEIRKLTQHFPDLHWLQFVRVDVEKATEVGNWKTPTPHEIVELIDKAFVKLNKNQSKLAILMKDKKWLVSTLIAIIGLILALIAIVATIIPNEIRDIIGLDNAPTEIHTITSLPSIEETDTNTPVATVTDLSITPEVYEISLTAEVTDSLESNADEKDDP